MPAHRGRTSQQSARHGRELRSIMASSSSRDSAEHVFMATPISDVSSDSAMDRSSSDPDIFEFEEAKYPQQSKSARKKPAGHIPRPPNAFILFRSSFIKSRHVSTGVETNHSTLSKIIGMTWQNLPDSERQKWHARAKQAQDDHRCKFPQYSFRPVHNKAKGGEKRKLREVGPKDTKRCAKIAELLVCGKKGQELEEAIQEFDKYHVPEIVTRFDTPITENTYLSPSSPTSRKSRSLSPLPSFSPKQSARVAFSNSSPQLDVSTPPKIRLSLDAPHNRISYDPPSFNYADSQPDLSPSFDFNSFSYAVQQPSPPLTRDYAPPLTPPFPSFDFIPPQDSSHLLPNPQYTAGMDEWTRQGSPLSNGTCSMPTTPAHMTAQFPESYATFNDVVIGPEYPPLTRSHDYSQYSCYTPIEEQRYEAKEPLVSGAEFLRRFDSEIDNSPLIEDESALSSFMASLRPQQHLPHIPYSAASNHLSFRDDATYMDHH